MNSLANALQFAAIIAHYNLAEVESYSMDLIELSTRHRFSYWLTIGTLLRGWARSASRDTTEGILWIEQGIREYRASGSVIGLPFWLVVKAEALHLANRTSEAIEAINEAEALAVRFEQRWYCAERHRSAVCFSRVCMVRTPKVRLHCAKPSESHGSRSRFR